MQCTLKICLGIWIFMRFTKCHPTVQPILTKPFEWKEGKSELVYPQLHSVDDLKIKAQNSDSLPIVVLRTSTEAFYIELRPNKDLLQSDNASRKDGDSYAKDCHFHGTILSHPEGVAAISICEHANRMLGTIMVRRDTYILRPLDYLEEEELFLHLQNSSSNIRGIEPHVISKIENPLTGYCGHELNDITVHLPENDIDSHHRSRRSEDASVSDVKHKVIETSVFVDYSLYRKFVVDRKKSKSQLIDTVLGIINQVQIIYNYEPLKIKFRIAVVKLEILMKGKDAPDPVDGDIDAYLDNFCSWQSSVNTPEGQEKHWDHSILLSGYDLYKIIDGKKNRKVLGLAWVNGMCRPKHSCTINEGSSFEAAFVIAHEMGHSLGMLHDGIANECDPNGFLMAEKTGPGRITWSSCSNDYLQRFFRKGRGNCLQDDNANSVPSVLYKFDDQLPGYRFDLEAQCKLSLGEDYQPHIMSKVPFDNVCRQLWCASGLWASVAHPALEGSKCGNGGKCIEGKCKGGKSNLSPQKNNSLADVQKMVVEFLDKLKIAFRFMLP